MQRRIQDLSKRGNKPKWEAPTCHLAKSGQKLHENEENLTDREKSSREVKLSQKQLHPIEVAEIYLNKKSFVTKISHQYSLFHYRFFKALFTRDFQISISYILHLV